MERSWWWKAALYGAVTVLACLYLVPTVVPSRTSSPPHPEAHFTSASSRGSTSRAACASSTRSTSTRRSRPRSTRSPTRSRTNIRKQDRATSAVRREGRDEIIFKFKNPADVAKLDNEVLAEYRDELDEVARDQAKGVVRYRLDPDQVAEIQDLALRQGIETIRGRVDKFGVSEPTIIKKGTDIVVELPGLEQRGLRAHQVDHRPHRPAGVQGRRRQAANT